MERLERFYIIEQLLDDRRIVPIEVFLERLEVSRATFKRDLEYLRSRLHAPIEWDREHGGYRFGEPDPHAPKHELPGFWFNESEIHALLTMQHLLANLQPGLLGPHIQPLLARLRAIMGSSGSHTAEAIQERVRILHMASRPVRHEHFGVITRALLQRRRLRITYLTRTTGKESQRDVSPQRLVHYRDNWYLDAWCHAKDDLRVFSVDAIRKVMLLPIKARHVPKRELQAILEIGYGIFSGRDARWAKLCFTAERARWVATEQWHPKQRTHVEPDGSYILEFPYSDSRELLGDILRHGEHVEVLAPVELRNEVAAALRRAAAVYQRGSR
jgi:predicted DNA-binding transcriptional regulator YafY